MSVVPEYLEKQAAGDNLHQLLLCLVKAVEAQTVAIREQNTLIAEANEPLVVDRDAAFPPAEPVVEHEPEWTQEAHEAMEAEVENYRRIRGNDV